MAHRIPVTHSDYEAAKSVCRRSDLFAAADAAHAQTDITTDITYRSGRREGEVTMLSEVEQNRQLDSTSLALLIVLCDLVRQGRCVSVRWHGDVRQAIQTHGYELARAVFGRTDGKAYRRLGVAKTPSPGPPISALDRLQGVQIARSSHWIDAHGRTVAVGESFHLIDFVAWKVVDGKDQIFIGISPAILEELAHGSIAHIPASIVQALPRQGAAGRVGAFLLSHRPIQGSHREIGAEALVTIIRPAGDRHPDVSRSHYIALLRQIVQTLNHTEPRFCWNYHARPGHLGKVSCDPRKPVKSPT